ncbi:ABC transporter ATP-binding protein [Pararhizobium mangrovi]|uniref:ABC transporter ATP-binding protein n=1 Tax=Pararhizobium mangrovi TaxID=2590452 RepID=A0A506TZQ6_9HYPH|nr:ABC transporter ATP-binding protein [Pararhizobium mangrovi]TPW27562.1 ABC transporter ATP-binding protein [Pararhizobium mangrovi]
MADLPHLRREISGRDGTSGAPSSFDTRSETQMSVRDADPARSQCDKLNDAEFPMALTDEAPAKEGVDSDVRLTLHDVTIEYPLSKTSSSRFSDFARTVGGQFVSHDDRRFIRALDRISLDFPNGSRVGLLGGNGSGKSTLLRTLAGILPLTAGERIIRGQIATLFSAGVGIDPEKNGIANIYRMAALYNIPRRRVPELIDDIVEFTELGEFIELPVKSYSSGMASRLGFGFVTNINADVILVDEVIGTGDNNFKDKARERMERFLADRGIIVVASHSVEVLETLCHTGLVLDQGSVAFYGDIAEAGEFHRELKKDQKKRKADS